MGRACILLRRPAPGARGPGVRGGNGSLREKAVEFAISPQAWCCQNSPSQNTFPLPFVSSFISVSFRGASPFLKPSPGRRLSIIYVLWVWRCLNPGADMPLDKGTTALPETGSLSSFPTCCLFPQFCAFFLCQTSLLLSSDEPSLSLLSYAEEPLRCGHLLPEGVPKPPARTVQPNSGKLWKVPCLLFDLHASMAGWGRGGRMINFKIWFSGDLKLLQLPGILPSAVAFLVTLSLYNGSDILARGVKNSQTGLVSCWTELSDRAALLREASQSQVPAMGL